jgi:hypothetical protein
MTTAVGLRRRSRNMCAFMVFHLHQPHEHFPELLQPVRHRLIRLSLYRLLSRWCWQMLPPLHPPALLLLPRSGRCTPQPLHAHACLIRVALKMRCLLCLMSKVTDAVAPRRRRSPRPRSDSGCPYSLSSSASLILSEDLQGPSGRGTFLKKVSSWFLFKINPSPTRNGKSARGGIGRGWEQQEQSGARVHTTCRLRSRARRGCRRR